MSDNKILNISKQASIGLICACMCMLVGCQDSSDSGIGDSEEVLVHQAKKALKDNKHHAALESLTHLSNNYQVGAKAQVYRLELIHSLYMAKEYSRAIDAADQYIKIYPYENNVDYALYIKVLSSMKEFNGRHWLTQSAVERYGYTDTKILDNALVAANQLIATYPSSPYIAEAKTMASQIREIFLKKNYHIARDQRRRKAYAASQRRLTDVVVNTESKVLLRQALEMMRDNYQSMNQQSDADKIDQIIDLNWKS